MLKRIRQIKRIWDLTKDNPEIVDVVEKVSLNKDIILEHAKAVETKQKYSPANKAVFMHDMNQSELEQHIENTKGGWEPFNNLVKNIFGK